MARAKAAPRKSKGKTGDPQCSAAMSVFASKGRTAGEHGITLQEAYGLLGKCRSKSSRLKSADRRESAGDQAGAAKLRGYARRGVTQKGEAERSKRAAELVKARAERKKAAPAPPAAPAPKPAAKAPAPKAPRAKKGKPAPPDPNLKPGERSDYDLVNGPPLRPTHKPPKTLRDPVDRYIYKRLGKPMDADTARAIAGAPKGAHVEFKRNDTEYVITAKGKTDDGIEYTFERKIVMGPTGDMHVTNESFKAQPPGGGFGVKAFAAQVETLSKLGVKSIETHAAGGPRHPIYNGYYTWPRFGYNAPLPRIAKQSVPDELEPVNTLHDLMRTPQGREWWKKNGESVDAEFDLTPGSESRRVLAAYEHNRNGMQPSSNATPARKT